MMSGGSTSSASRAVAGQAGDDDVEEGDDAINDGGQDSTDSVDDGHEAAADGAEEIFDLERTVNRGTNWEILDY